MPATIEVTSLADAGAGSLREAIAQADLDAAPDTITFAPSVRGTITLLSALPDLKYALTIDGPGAAALTVARSGAAGTPGFRIFTVPAGSVVSIAGLTVTGGTGGTGGAFPGFSGPVGGGISNAGTLAVTGSAISGNSVSGSFSIVSGGGIENSGALTITDSTISGNSASTFRGTASGGGINNSGTLTVNHSILSGNRAFYGGGIENSGRLTVTDSTLSGNSAGGGGGMDNGRGGTLTVADSTLSGNSASFGGGIFNAGTLAVTGSALSGNSAGTGGGGMDNDRGGTLTVADSTLSGNSAGLSGGGISNDGTLTIIDSTLSGNSLGGGLRIGGAGGGISNGGKLAATTSIFANPVGGNLALNNSAGTGSTFISLGHNLFSDAPAALLDPTDLTDTDPLLGPLADNGGPTMTQALLPGSPAIDAGAAVPGVTTDQRGVPRPQGTAPDIGAFESRGFALAVTGGDDQTADSGTPFPAPLAFALTSPFGEPVAGGRVTFTAPAVGPSASLASDTVALDDNGRGSVTATANGAGGSYTVTAGAAGANAVAWHLTNVAIPPVVVGLRRSGVHRQPTRLVLTFSEPMDPVRASDPRNYGLVRVGPLGRPGPGPHPIPVRSAAYDPAQRAVTVTPRRLGLHNYYRLTVFGAPPRGLTSAGGVPLDGSGQGQPGTNFVAVVHEFGAVSPAPFPAGPLGVIPRAIRPARAASGLAGATRGR